MFTDRITVEAARDENKSDPSDMIIMNNHGGAINGRFRRQATYKECQFRDLFVIFFMLSHQRFTFGVV